MLPTRTYREPMRPQPHLLPLLALLMSCKEDQPGAPETCPMDRLVLDDAHG